jgi:hypothetical protein
MRCRIGPCEEAPRASDFRPVVQRFSTFREYFGRKMVTGISLRGQTGQVSAMRDARLGLVPVMPHSLPE